MSLLIVVGYDGPGNSAKPFPVYMGRLSSEAEAAMAASPAARFEIIRNPVVLRKNGRGVAAAAPSNPTVKESLTVETPQPEAAALEADAEAAANEAAADPEPDPEPAAEPDPDPSATGSVSGKRRR